MRYLMHRLMHKSGAQSGLELMELLFGIWRQQRQSSKFAGVHLTFQNIEAEVQALRVVDVAEEVGHY